MENLISRAIYHPLVALPTLYLTDLLCKVDYSPGGAFVVLAFASTLRLARLTHRWYRRNRTEPGNCHEHCPQRTDADMKGYWSASSTGRQRVGSAPANGHSIREVDRCFAGHRGRWSSNASMTGTSCKPDNVPQPCRATALMVSDRGYAARSGHLISFQNAGNFFIASVHKARVPTNVASRRT